MAEDIANWIRLAAYLENKGFDPVICDLAAELEKDIQEKDYYYLWGLKAKNIWLDPDIFNLFIEKYDHVIHRCIEQILSFDAKFIGFSVIHSKQLITLEFARRIRRMDPSAFIIAGGPACFYDQDRNVLEKESIIDSFVLGEGEETLFEIMRNVHAGKGTGSIPGTKNLHDNYSDYIPRKPIQGLDHIPFPSYPGLDFETYCADPVPLFWSRGCMSRCSFCEIRNVWSSYRIRSAENIFEEIQFYVEKKSVSKFSVFDSLMNGKPEILEKLCGYIIYYGYKISWEGNIVSLPQMNERIYSKMKAAGCKTVFFGLETCSEDVLKKMKKPFSLEEAKRNIRLAHEAGLETSVNFITGFPGETEEDFIKAESFARDNGCWIDRVDFITECQVARGTDLFNNPESYGIIIPPDWQGYKWYSEDGNNDINVRQERTRRLGNILELSGVKINANYNLDDGNNSIKSTIRDNLK